jgi:CBS domain-containing protein
MALTLELKKYPRLMLTAETAAELMTPNPVSINENATLREALTLLTERGFKAAPVIDEAGRPVGVLSSTDLLIHDREEVDHLTASPETYNRAEMHTGQGEPLGRGYRVERVDGTMVRDVMTPAVFSVAPDTPAARVISEMVGLKVHRVFVVDYAGVLTGVITALDVLRHLEREEEEI